MRNMFFKGHLILISPSVSYTANICSGSTGFSLCTNPTAVSLHFLQTTNANIECKNCKEIFTVGCL